MTYQPLETSLKYASLSYLITITHKVNFFWQKEDKFNPSLIYALIILIYVVVFSKHSINIYAQNADFK